MAVFFNLIKKFPYKVCDPRKRQQSSVKPLNSFRRKIFLKLLTDNGQKVNDDDNSSREITFYLKVSEARYRQMIPCT